MHLQGGFSKAYNQQGVDKFYTQQGANYSNPHRYDIERVVRKKLSKPNTYINHKSRILDLACGGGQITVPLLSYGYTNIEGTDPYTYEIYEKNAKKMCNKFRFNDILQGCYQQQKFDCVICSYAMHLVKQTMLHSFCNKLAQLSKCLIIISPHKLPLMKEAYGWQQIQNYVLDKVHFRAYRSLLFQQQQKQKKFEQVKVQMEASQHNQAQIQCLKNTKQQQLQNNKDLSQI